MFATHFIQFDLHREGGGRGIVVRKRREGGRRERDSSEEKEGGREEGEG